jgi:mRNA (2'-O-methyladenosine-N6-)-methyltransferase
VDGPTVQFVKEAGNNKVESVEVKALGRTQQDMTILYPPQWVQCDLRYLDMTVLGQCTVHSFRCAFRKSIYMDIEFVT